MSIFYNYFITKSYLFFVKTKNHFIYFYIYLQENSEPDEDSESVPVTLNFTRAENLISQLSDHPDAVVELMSFMSPSDFGHSDDHPSHHPVFETKLEEMDEERRKGVIAKLALPLVRSDIHTVHFKEPTKLL